MEYGELPPKKLKRMRELVHKGLENHGLSVEEIKELMTLYKQAGGKLPD